MGMRRGRTASSTSRRNPRASLSGEPSVEDASIDAAAEVLHELAEDPAIDGADAPCQVDADARHAVPFDGGPEHGGASLD